MRVLTWWLLFMLFLTGAEAVRERRGGATPTAPPESGTFQAMEDTNGLPPPPPPRP